MMNHTEVLDKSRDSEKLTLKRAKTTTNCRSEHWKSSGEHWDSHPLTAKEV